MFIFPGATLWLQCESIRSKCTGEESQSVTKCVTLVTLPNHSSSKTVDMIEIQLFISYVELYMYS